MDTPQILTPAVQLLATNNLFRLSENKYSGRGLVVGLDKTGENLVTVYWLMGRSENSRNRVLSVDGDRVFTEAADPSKVTDPSLIIYNAMAVGRVHRDLLVHFVSNGKQTDAVAAQCCLRTFVDTMHQWQYEPDAPNFTPRISAALFWGLKSGKACAKISVIRKSIWGDAPERNQFEYSDVGAGFGYGVHTYMGNGNPLPPYVGEPQLFPLEGDIYAVANKYWDTLQGENRISVAVKFVDRAGTSQVVLRNRLQKVVL